jgi:hypothetical protein
MPRKRNSPAVTPVLDEASAVFVQSNVSINMTACDAARGLAVSRAYGCRVSEDRVRVTVYVYRDLAGDVLHNVESHGAVAVVFNRPSTHETLQLKGDDATVVAFDPREEPLLERYRQLFIADLLSIGHPPSFNQAIMERFEGEMAGIQFTPTVVFNSTPGPKAGQKLTP